MEPLITVSRGTQKLVKPQTPFFVSSTTYATAIFETLISIHKEGVQLDRGYISDEDTAIYNPGLTLLTESEKERLVEAVIESRKSGQITNTWDENNQVAFEFLKEKLDPLHMRELKGYLGILPIYAGVLYLGVLAVQQTARELFAPVYIGAASLIFLPIVVLVALGPQ